MIRPPAVAGRFYPGERVSLDRELNAFLAPEANSPKKIRALACIVPHAGYMYSGRVTGAVFGRIEIPSRVILVGPRHYPHGASCAILSEGEWQTPLGSVPIDRDLAQKLARACPLLCEDAVAHSAEHAIEVQLPFLQKLAPSFAFVPIALGATHYAQLESFGEAIGKVVASEPGPILLVASSDMNHYESDALTRVKDRKAIDRILALDPRGLFDTIRSEDISMCGYGGAVAMLIAARKLGATHAELVRYATSGEINGMLSEVVGYAGMIVT